MILLIQDFPSYKAGQNGSQLDQEKFAERARTRSLGFITAREAYDHYLHGERLRVVVSCLRPQGRNDGRIDMLNVGGMLKGYFDGFTDAGLWRDDAQVVDVRYRWMTRWQADVWLEAAGEEDQRHGLLIFEILVEGANGEDDSECEPADADPAGDGGERDQAGPGGQELRQDQGEAVPAG